MTNRWDPSYLSPGRWAAPRSDAHLRASDAERNEVAERLSRHYAEGRLDEAEFKARLDRAMGATTRGDLSGLFDDLPRLAEDHQPRQRARRRLLPLLVIMALAAGAASWSFSMVHVPFVFVVAIGLFLWFRVGHSHHHHARPEVGP